MLEELKQVRKIWYVLVVLLVSGVLGGIGFGLLLSITHHAPCQPGACVNV